MSNRVEQFLEEHDIGYYIRYLTHEPWEYNDAIVGRYFIRLEHTYAIYETTLYQSVEDSWEYRRAGKDYWYPGIPDTSDEFLRKLKKLWLMASDEQPLAVDDWFLRKATNTLTIKDVIYRFALAHPGSLQDFAKRIQRDDPIQTLIQYDRACREWRFFDEVLGDKVDDLFLALLRS